jgi:hypothetical protein
MSSVYIMRRAIGNVLGWLAIFGAPLSLLYL